MAGAVSLSVSSRRELIVYQSYKRCLPCSLGKTQKTNEWGGGFFRGRHDIDQRGRYNFVAFGFFPFKSIKVFAFRIHLEGLISCKIQAGS